MVYSFKDEKGNHLIPSEDIVSVTENGIIVKKGSAGFQFYPAASITLSESWDDASGIPSVPDKVNYDTFLAPATGVTKNVYRYLFGINSIFLQRKVYREVAGIITPPVHIDSASYIQLSVRHTDCTRSLEFSILEGENETPILPMEYSFVQKEKIFPGLPLRFKSQTGKAPAIYRNGERVNVSFEDLEESDVAANGYYADYYPEGQSYFYYPEKDTDIFVKIIERCPNGELPVTIKSLTIQKYGGLKLWSI